MATQKLQPFPWYGAKFKWLDFILPNLPHRKRYVEPFGGSAAVLLNREPSGIEAYNDKDESVANFFRVLRERPDDLVDSLRNTPYHEAEFELASNTQAGDANLESEHSIDADLELARRFFISSTMAYNSATGTGSFSYSTTESRRGMAQHTSRFQSKAEHLQDVAERLKRVQFFSQDAVEFMERFDKPDTLIYLDPPYPLETRGGSAYKHEMDREQHLALIDFVRETEADVAISTYQCDLYDGMLLSGWNRLDSEAKKTAASNSEQDRTEALYVNYSVPESGFVPPNEQTANIGDFT